MGAMKASDLYLDYSTFCEAMALTSFLCYIPLSQAGDTPDVPDSKKKFSQALRAIPEGEESSALDLLLNTIYKTLILE